MQGFLRFLWLAAALALAGAAGAAESPQQAPAPVPHVALLLPLNSADFGGAADAVKQGFMAASAIQSGDLPVKVYPTGDKPDDIVSAYAQATQAGARIVVGPLTRNGVAELLAGKAVTVPTLALNLPDHDQDLPPKLYFLALAGDIEARQVAKLAAADGKKTATVIASGGTFQKRIQQAFSAAWIMQGGTIADRIDYDGSDRDAVRDALKQHPVDMLFLAMDGSSARVLRPYLDTAIPAYATSEIFAGSRDPQKYHDLDGVRFVDMPWLLQPDHMAVMVYPKPQEMSAEMERLYALGIDAWRLALMLLQDRGTEPLVLDGVTGQLELDPASHQFNRTPLQAVFRDGGGARGTMTPDTGRQAESVAQEFLQRQGMKLVAKNYRCRQGEIDLIMEDRATSVFVEVRLRQNPGFGGAAESITRHKQARVIRAAQHYLQGLTRQPPCRFDAVLLDGSRIEWIKDAFSA